MFLEFWKLVKSKKILKKACAQSGVSAMFVALHRHDDEKDNILLFYLEFKSKKLQDSCSLACNNIYGIAADCKMVQPWNLLYNSCSQG